MRADHIHSRSEIVFDPEKLTFSIGSGHTTTSKRPGSYSLPYSMQSLWKICKRISPNSPFWSGNMTTSTREPFTCSWIRADIWRQDDAICSKNRKIVPYHRCAGVLRLTVSIPDYGSWCHLSLGYEKKARLKSFTRHVIIMIRHVRSPSWTTKKRSTILITTTR